MDNIRSNSKEWQVGKFKIRLAIQDWFRLDGGIIYSGVPKEKWRDFWLGVSTLNDERSRVQLSVNCFLITAPSGLRILVDTSFGDVGRWQAKTRDDFHMLNGFNLFDCGHANHQLDQPHFVIPTHLHFDHAGGCVRLEEGDLLPAFPDALYIMHKEEIKHAFSVHPRTMSSYLRETMLGIDALIKQKRVSKIRVVRWENPMGEGGITVIRTRGHTPGHLSVKIESEGEVAFIPGALVPTRWHINILACGMGDDTHGLEAVNHKMLFLEQATKENWLLLLGHDPDVAGRVVKDAKGNYAFVVMR